MSNSAKIQDALRSMGYKLIDNSDHWRASALYRGGDNHGSLVIYKDSGVWHDYGVGVLSQPFERLVQLTIGTKDKNSVEKYLSGIDRTQSIIEEKVEKEPDVYDPSCLSKLLPHHKFYLDKGIEESLLLKFNGGLATSGKMYQRYIFPIYDSKKRIIGFSGRNMSESSDRPKWKHIGKKSEWLFPLYYDGVSKAIADSKEVILVESIGDVLSLMNAGIFNVICIFGLSVSSKILATLNSFDLEYVVFALNRERNNGLLGCVKNYIKFTEFFDPDQMKICLPLRNDFGEMNNEEIQSWVKKKNSFDGEDQVCNICKYARNFNKEGLLSDAAMRKLEKYCD